MKVCNFILIGFILLILLYFNYWNLFIIVTILFNCFSYIDLKLRIKNYHKYIEYWVYSYIYIYIYMYMYLSEIYFCSNYDLIYMILDNLTMLWLWYIEFLFLLYYWFQVKDYYKYILILSIWFLYTCLNKIYFCYKLWFHIYDYEQSNYELILIPS